MSDRHDPALDPEASAERSEAVEMMACILDHMSEEMRTVFLLFELEQMTTAEIAAMLHLPAGTVASRLRRAREKFKEQVLRLEALDRRVKR